MVTKLRTQLKALTEIWKLLGSKGYTDFEEVKTAQATPVVNLNGVFPVNDLRDEVQTANSGSVTNSDAEYRVHHTAAGDFARFVSAERGDYQPGKGCEAGSGIRFDTESISGDGVGYGGYFDMEHTNGTNSQNIREGFLFGLDKFGFFVEVVSGGSSKHKVYETKFNRNKRVGSLTDGYVFQVDFPYYGHGLVKFYQVVGKTGDKQGKKRLLHTYKSNGETSLKSPNLQVGALVKSSTATGDFSIYVAGRQFSINGKYIPNKRNVSQTTTGAAYSTASFTPIVSFQKKSDFREVAAQVKDFLGSIDQDAIMEVRLNGTLTGANFGIPSRTNSSDTAFNTDTDATAIDTTTGVKLHETFIESGQGNKPGDIISPNQLFGSVPDEGIISFSLMSTTTSDGTADFTAQLQERW